MKTAFSVLIAVTGVFLGGCSSYRLQGNVTGTDCIPTSGANKYRIDSVVLKAERVLMPDGQSMSDPWALPTAAEKYGEEAIGRCVMTRKPNLFSSTGETIPVAVSIRVHNEPKDGTWSAILPFVTLGLSPFLMGTPSHCDVTVVFLDDPNLRQSCVLKYRSDVLFSVLSPLGLILYNEVPEATACRRGNGIMTAPQLDTTCGRDRDTVFFETLAAGIESCIRNVEKRTPPSVLAQFGNDPQEGLDTPASSEKSMLRRLDELKKKGVLTEEACEAKRKAWSKHL